MTKQRFIDADEAMDIVDGDHVAVQFVSKHRWFTKQLVVFERDGELLGLHYFEPATEEQEDADRFEGDSVLVFPVQSREVVQTVYEPKEDAMKMPEEARKQVIAALRSGEYRQGHGALARIDGTHCCLGVACREAIKDGVGLTVYVGHKTINFDGQTGHLPRKVVEWLGLSIGRINPLYDGLNAIDRNDTHKETFDQIADAMERGIS